MNLLQLILKNMRQRSLSTWLTLLSVTLGVTLACAIMLVRRGGGDLFAQSDFGYDVLVGPNGSPLQLVLNSVYHIDVSPGNIPYSVLASLRSPAMRPLVRLAVPFAVGDTYKGLRIIGATPAMFGFNDDGTPAAEPFEYRLGRSFRIADGSLFHPQKFQAVIGSEVTRLTGLQIGDRFFATHGAASPDGKEDVHEEVQWEVVGRLESTGTANDRLLFIPLISFYAIPAHEDALEKQFLIRQGVDPAKAANMPRLAAAAKPADAPAAAHDDHAHDDHDHAAPATAPADADHDVHDHDEHDDHDHDGHDHDAFSLAPDGTIRLNLPQDQWQLSGIMVKSRGGVQALSLIYQFRVRGEAQAVNPATVMREFFQTFLGTSAMILLVVAALVTVVAAVGILVSIYNSVTARVREIAILRALGATRRRVLAIICLEAGAIGFVGGLVGIAGGYFLASAGSMYMKQSLGEGFSLSGRYPEVWLFLAVVVLVALLAGLVPALRVYRSPVAENLVHST